MAPRDPNRPKAAHLPDVPCLLALLRGEWPPTEHATLPAKVLRHKLEKLAGRGLVQGQTVTHAGRLFVAERTH